MGRPHHGARSIGRKMLSDTCVARIRYCTFGTWHHFEQGRSERTAADIVAQNDVRAFADLVHHFDDLSPLTLTLPAV
jgi:hypothetical protein